jgi:hypothetical protein
MTKIPEATGTLMTEITLICLMKEIPEGMKDIPKGPKVITEGPKMMTRFQSSRDSFRTTRIPTSLTIQWQH